MNGDRYICNSLVRDFTIGDGIKMNNIISSRWKDRYLACSKEIQNKLDELEKST